MKIFKSIVIVALVFHSYSCKNCKDAAATSAQQNDSSTRPEVSKVDTLKKEIYRLVVSFYSTGAGAEFNLIQKFEDSIGEFSAKVGKNIDYEPYKWGREGESDFCLKLTEITSEQQEEFIRSTKELLSTGKWVHLYENQPCRRHGMR